MKVAILGCGPTGLLAAHACAMNAVDFTILSKRRKSFLFGSQYLHEPIPGISDFDRKVEITYRTDGSPAEYRRKVHGPAWDGVILPEDFEQHDQAWDIRFAYDRLWAEYGRMVQEFEIPMKPEGNNNAGHWNIPAAISRGKLHEYDLVVSTVPRTYWKMPGDQFIHSSGWVLGDAPEHGQFCPFTTPQDNMIICNGEAEPSWTRLSRVFDYTTVEWPGGTKPPIPGISEIIKPLRFEAGPIPPPPNWMFVGRYGKWHKGVLVTDAFNEVLQATGTKPEWIYKKEAQ